MTETFGFAKLFPPAVSLIRDSIPPAQKLSRGPSERAPPSVRTRLCDRVRALFARLFERSFERALAVVEARGQRRNLRVRGDAEIVDGPLQPPRRANLLEISPILAEPFGAAFGRDERAVDNPLRERPDVCE